MRTRSVQEQIDALQSSVTSGFAAHLHHWFLAGAAFGLMAAIVFWHPVPLMIAIFLGLIGLAERQAGPNIVAAITAYQSGIPRAGWVSIRFECWDSDNHYHATVREQGHPDWEYEFIPQGWQPRGSDYPAQIWREATAGQPVLAVVEEGLLIPRYVAKPVPEQSRAASPAGEVSDT
jgi:hypothetical protein